MNSWQLTKVARQNLRDRKWKAVPTNEHVFKSNSVRITPIDIEDMLGVGTPSSPVCKINLGRRTSDKQSKGYVAQELVVTLAVAVEGDEMLENSTVGANRSALKASSKGRGISEVESEMFAVLENVTAMQGFQVQGYSAGAVEVTRISTTVAFVTCEYTFLFYVTSQETWLSPTSLVATAHTGGTVGLVWVPVPTNWATIAASGGQVIRYAAGSTPPPTYADGIAGPAVTGTASSATISGLSSGAYAISIFTRYRESGADSADDSWSDPTTILVAVP